MARTASASRKLAATTVPQAALLDAAAAAPAMAAASSTNAANAANAAAALTASTAVASATVVVSAHPAHPAHPANAAEVLPPEPTDRNTDRNTDHTALQLGPLGGLLGFHLARASVTTFALFEQHVGQPFGLRKVEYSLLLLVLVNGPLSPKRLARALALSAPNLTMLLDRLQQRGLLRRERSLVDRRSQNVVLTDEGQRIAQATANQAAPMERALNDKLSPAEHAMLIELLCKVAGA